MSTGIEKVAGTGIPLLLDDIDTDRIIPARFLRCVTFEGLGEHAFEDDRLQDPEHPFDNEKYAEASVLVAARNFGCGSSREHAPQALMRWGIKAIIAESYAEIFFGNCTSLGIPAVTAEEASLVALDASIKENPSAEITVDLEAMTVTAGENSYPVSMPKDTRDALLTGKYDFMGELLSAKNQVAAMAEKIPYVGNFAS